MTSKVIYVIRHCDVFCICRLDSKMEVESFDERRNARFDYKMKKNKVNLFTITVHEASNRSEERQKWHQKLKFLMSFIEDAVGLCYTWRFSYFVLQNHF